MNTKELEVENIMRALSEEPILKLCTHCKHFDNKNGSEKCIRDVELDINPVNGKKTTLGEVHQCSVERETMGSHPLLVKKGSLCGAIGQHWEKGDPNLGKGRFYFITRWFKK